MAKSKYCGDYDKTLNQLLAHQDLSDVKEGEIWKEVIGFEGEYMVSNFGRVKSIKSTYISGSTTRKGYKMLTLRKRKTQKRVNIFVHRLVAMMFIENKKKKPQVNHKDGDKSNNKVENLEWATGSENQTHAVGFLSSRCKPCAQYTMDGEFVAEYPSQKEAAKAIGVYYKNINQCILGRSKSSGGYIWKRV